MTTTSGNQPKRREGGGERVWSVRAKNNIIGPIRDVYWSPEIDKGGMEERRGVW